MARLIDTNILLRWIDEGAPEHELILSALDTLDSQGEELVVAPQNIIEFWSAATRPAGPPANGLGFTLPQATAGLAAVERVFQILPETAAIYSEWRRLVLTMGISGRQVYDARIAATMLVNNISHILTFNVNDFRRYLGIIPVHPRDVIVPSVESEPKI